MDADGGASEAYGMEFYETDISIPPKVGPATEGCSGQVNHKSV